VYAAHSDHQQAACERAFAFYQQVETELARVWQGYGEVDAAHRQLDARKKKGGAEAEAPLQKSIEAYEKKLEPLREGKGEVALNLGAVGMAIHARVLRGIYASEYKLLKNSSLGRIGKPPNTRLNNR
jgi:hypothetical protein